jgi:DNA-binding MarR family transcriptional regulator
MNLLERLERYSHSVRPELSAKRGIVRRLTEQQVAELVDLYNAGAIINDLARHFEIHRTTVSLHLLRRSIRDRRRA